MKPIYYGWALGLATLASGCSVYAPLIPATPLLEHAGEVELQAGLHTPSAVTGSVSYSPLPHLLLTATGAANLNRGDTTYFRYRHAEVGAGYYTVLGGRTYLGLLGGYGRTHSSRGYLELGSGFLFFPARNPLQYEARYNRYFAQAYLASVGNEVVSWGGTLRATAVDFSRLTRNDEPVTQAARVYLEPSAFLRIGRSTSPWQGFGAIGWSVPLRTQRLDSDPTLSLHTLLLSGGVVLRPKWLGQGRE
ncbi:hypothetical protein [Hymenobacter edaphi]|uniref:Uncharacterized protein n=1 Tax=Hymenobacter edaphi TaxID=2211146 RepID=A0A328BAW2_9BACT|nr:hypothetical protein [Hymenobacter edaphi]RAK63909.1 hypothetical protein DLM85_20400 [Hymenobacter edaphi]